MPRPASRVNFHHTSGTMYADFKLLTITFIDIRSDDSLSGSIGADLWPIEY